MSGSNKHALWPISAAVSAILASNAVWAEEATIEKTTETIIIVGEKTDKTLKDTASSVSVIREELNSLQYKSVNEAVSEIPNIVTLSGAVPDIRGVSGNGSAGGFNSISGGAKGRVTTLIDGVAQPFVADLTGDSGIWDIEQIEVYRGPQSTSNGRNSIAGAIYIKTQDPSDEWEGKVRLGYRDQQNYFDTAAVVSGPIVEDTLSFRISAQHVDGETLTDDKGFDTNPTDVKLNELETTRITSKLKWTANDDLSVMLSHVSNNEQGDTGRIYYKADDLSKYSKLFFRIIETDVATTSLTADYRINDGMSVDVLVASMDYKWGFDSYEATPEAEQQLEFTETNTTVDTKLNFGLNSKTLNGFVGFAYFDRSHEVESLGAYLYNGEDESDSVAIYGEVNYALAEDFNVIAGARVEEESQKRHFVYGAIDADLDKETNIFLPKLVLQYKATDNTTLSASARKGYNAAGGALNFAAQEYYYYDEETVNTFEMSSRSSLNDGQLFISANLFYNQYDGYQALSSTRSIVNMDEVETYGLELEVTSQLTDDLELKGGLGLLATEIIDAGEDYPDIDGNELNSAPKTTFNFGAKYWLNDQINLGANFSHVAEYFGDFANTEERIAGDYSLLRLNANYELENWLIAAFVNNALDEEGFVAKEPEGRRYPTGYVSIITPRTVGVSVTYSF